ncbi:hypothetical protein DFH09DRAFT_1139692 [Mycena vulgaris]|nr:hypothetical protein DFH09DRAFT_1139692 [Mycena vulgaris]
MSDEHIRYRQHSAVLQEGPTPEGQESCTCYTLLSGFRIPWPLSCYLDELTPFVVSDEREFRHLNLMFGVMGMVMSCSWFILVCTLESTPVWGLPALEILARFTLQGSQGPAPWHSVHPKSPVLPTKNGPLETLNHQAVHTHSLANSEFHGHHPVV